MQNCKGEFWATGLSSQRQRPRTENPSAAGIPGHLHSCQTSAPNAPAIFACAVTIHSFGRLSPAIERYHQLSAPPRTSLIARSPSSSGRFPEGLSARIQWSLRGIESKAKFVRRGLQRRSVEMSLWRYRWLASPASTRRLNSADCRRGTLRDCHSSFLKCLARSTICPQW
jgi:hypothetical protein